MKRTTVLLIAILTGLSVFAQSDAFEQFRKQQEAAFNQFRDDQQAEYDAYRKRVNEEYAEFMRRAWDQFPMQQAEQPVEEKIVPPEIFPEPEEEPAEEPKVTPKEEPKQEPKVTPKEEPKQEPKVTPKEEPKQEPKVTPKEESKVTPKEEPKVSPKPTPKPEPKSQPIAVKPTVVVVPEPAPAPDPIAPVQPKPEAYKRVSVSYFGALVTIGFPANDDLKIAAMNEDALADAWKHLSASKYDIMVKTALDIRKASDFNDWAYMNVLRDVTEKHYGKTNEAILAQAFLMTQSGYRVRLGMAAGKLYMLVASLYDIYGLNYYKLEGTKFYLVNGTGSKQMQICSAKFGKEQSLSLQLARLPKLGSEPTPKRKLTSRKGVMASVSVNKSMIDFFNTYPQACFNGDYTTRWAAYANTPLEPSIREALYPQLKKVINGMSEREAVGILLNWVQTAFEYELDDKVWGGDRAFFAQETLYYPYCDCEDRSILFSRLVRDLVGLDVVLLYYPGHLATAVAFSEDGKGDWLSYKNRKYIVCDPTYINAGVGYTMPGMNNQQAQVIALK